jgi:3'(2'), 5'-bisphosphate nucleotidase
MAYERELAAALEACQLCLPRVLDEYSRFQPIADAAADIKLTIDRETQDTLLHHLDAAFPQDTFRAEEDTPTLARIQGGPRNPDRVWVLDPIDGTRGFAMKNGEFAVMVALLERHQVVVGVVSEPNRERVTYAVRGGGCWQRNGARAAARCQVGRAAAPKDATLVVSRPSNPAKRSRFVDALSPARIIQTYSAGIKMALVACGEADLYLNWYPNVHDWDVCSGHILVEEAGGKVTSRVGEPVVYDRPGAERNGLLASNGVIHEAALAALAPV